MTVTLPATNGVASVDNPLFRSYQMGPFKLNHRIVYAPLTRCRSPNSLPTPLVAEYYAQRATPGALMISEGTVVSERGHGYPQVPGIYTQEQIEAWKPVIQGVHDKGATFFCQLWHVGRASHPHYQPNEDLPICSSAVPITDGNQPFSLKSMQPEVYPTPRALEVAELPGLVEEFVQAAKNARAAGFDGVELHSANGYLLDEFLKDEINQRTDAYGGCIENRCRFVLEVVKAVADAIDADRVGIRLSPFGGFLNATDSHPYALISYLIEEINKIGISYIHMGRAGGNSDLPEDSAKTLTPFRKIWKGTFIAAGGYQRENAMEAIETGHADLVCFGRWHLANPDFVKRLAIEGAPLNKYNRDTFYSFAPEGYTDYPYLEETEWGKENAEKLKAFQFAWEKK
ncbi:hypothetical protein KSW81_002518 [Nannochloris sp. 'desiccata']|nr:hypothetical protein KSW81_002518 [Chlorella desiccata (nom. nud.)]